MKYYSLPQKIRSLRAKLGIAVSRNMFVDISPSQAYSFANALDKYFKITCNKSKYIKIKINPQNLRK